VHVDFHEQAIDEPYYFPPAAEPYHQVITNWQRDFQKDIGKKHASEFDKNNWLYFSKEVFDLLYPSYGDTYPMYSGSIGMTYEQGGSGRAGLSVLTKVGDTLELKDRVLHHVTTGLSTVELSSNKADKLIKEYQNYRKDKKFTYKSFILSGKPELLAPVISLLQKNKIKIELAPENTTIKTYNYQTAKMENYSIRSGDILISVDQEKGTLANVLLEPKTKLSDSLTYDITAWNLSYAFGVDAFASENKISGKPFSNSEILKNRIEKRCYGYLARWNTIKSVKFLTDLQAAGFKVSYHNKAFKLNGQSYEPGTLLILRGENKRTDFDEKLIGIADLDQIELSHTNTGYVDEGLDFGIHLFLEADLESALKEINTLIIPKGYFNLSSNEGLKKWVEKGGNLIVLGTAAASFSSSEFDYFGIKRIEHQDTAIEKVRFGDIERTDISGVITGAIYKCELDKTHPLTYGMDRYETLRQNADIYKLAEGVTSLKLEKNALPMNGFVGSQVKDQQSDALIGGVHAIGSGKVIYLIDNPLFRCFWERGKLLFSNAVYLF